MTFNASRARLQRLANAYQISCAVHAAASLKLGNLLKDGPIYASEIATQLGLKEDILIRFMRFLQTLGVVRILEDGRYAETEMSPFLDEIDNIAEGPEALKAWAELSGVLGSGDNAFAIANNSPFYEFAAANKEKADRWTKRNDRIATQWAKPTIEALALNGHERIVDLGGGSGALLAAIIEAYPKIDPVMWELPQAAENAKSNLARLGLDKHVELITGDLTKGHPPKADIYIFCRVLLNMSDKDALRALSLCKARMAASSKLIIIEALMPSSPSPERLQHYAHDLHLMLLWGGRQRTEEEFSTLLEKAGLKTLSRRDVSSTEGAIWHILASEIQKPK